MKSGNVAAPAREPSIGHFMNWFEQWLDSKLRHAAPSTDDGSSDFSGQQDTYQGSGGSGASDINPSNAGPGSTNCSQIGSGAGGEGLNAGRNSAPSGHSGAILGPGAGSKHNHNGGNEPNDDDNEDEAPPKGKKTKGVAVQRLACPFYKRNPEKYKSERTCSGPGWRDVAKVKYDSLIILRSLKTN